MFWDGEGFIMLYKRFENGHLSWPRNSNEAKELSAQLSTPVIKCWKTPI
ncbi:transposase [Limosilactobacillus reuteri]|nr:IS66 family insertion sequence element accessory protein TnpB [Limosilactobacillus reuteri]MCC4457650.1 transposase [Limosilactobacillus reuteri]